MNGAIVAKVLTGTGDVKTSPGLLWGISVSDPACVSALVAVLKDGGASGTTILQVAAMPNFGGQVVTLAAPVAFSSLYLDVSGGDTPSVTVFYE